MSRTRYMDDIVTLSYDVTRCTGCGWCVEVCPHAVFALEARPARARVTDRDACMECGACARNCAFGAIQVQAGVGCASAIIKSWVTGGKPSCGAEDCGDSGCC